MDATINVPFTGALSLALALSVLYLLRSMYGRRNLPPGPRALPLIGNLHQLPALHQHKTFREWAAQYGNIVYAEFLQQPVIILSSARDAVELMEKRGAKYSDRPRFTYLNDLIKWTAGMPWMPYNDMWKLQRRWFQHTLIARSAVESIQPIQDRETKRLLIDLVRDPADFMFHLKRFVVAVIFEMGYGRTITTLDDDFIKLVERGVSESLEGAGAGGALVDMFPILQYLPPWFPGADFRRAAERSRVAIRAVEDIPYDQVKQEMAAETAKASFARTTIEGYQATNTLTDEIEYQIKGAGGLLYVGGTDTTSTSLLVFVMQMMLHPDVLHRAQEELDLVIGDTRLPEFEDRPSLPYIECVVREVYRFCPPVPLAVPHQAAEDDVYRGYHIPKKSSVIANVWAMSRDPEHYQDPDEFRPERFLDVDFDGEAEIWDPKKLVFGFGRRICPGRYLADNNVWLVIARLAATTNIRKARGKDGSEVTPVPEFLSGIVIHPKPFACDIQPRSEKSKQLILDSAVGL